MLLSMGMSKATIFTIVELLFSLACFSLSIDSETFYHTENVLCELTFGGFTVILLGILVGTFLGCRPDTKIILFFTTLGCILFFICGTLSVKFFSQFNYMPEKGLGLAKAGFALVNGTLFFIDSFITFQSHSHD